MTVHLKKLSVGSVSIDSLKSWQNRRTRQGLPIIHPTRNWPRRADELLDGGCLFWIIKGQICVRQPIADLIEVKREDGRPACGIVLAPQLIPVWPRRVRIFQGWRYLEPADAPEDMPQSDDATPMPAELASELRELGLL
ncbi:hypothetical protein HIMB100_00011870 [SAR116 cluster alpha proteobacterium HIMB100]|nr:hypothetical protein HIMB100_00011870 [SAR116 cluster alpha proteobacterium HIMB100]